MLWHILDFKSKADLIKSGESIFEIKQVIATNEGINDYDQDDLIFETKSVDKKRQNTIVGDRMFGVLLEDRDELKEGPQQSQEILLDEDQYKEGPDQFKNSYDDTDF